MVEKSTRMKTIILPVLAISLLIYGNTVKAQDAKFQSLIIYNITKLLDWPDKSGNFTIRVIGNSELVKELKDFTNERKVGGRQDFDIQKAESGTVENCHILFVGANESASVEQILSQVGSRPILIITEKPDLVAKGAGISLIKSSGTWQFQYREENIKKAGIKVSLDFKELGIAR
jgi:hypothetical protein